MSGLKVLLIGLPFLRIVMDAQSLSLHLTLQFVSNPLPAKCQLEMKNTDKNANLLHSGVRGGQI